MIAFHNSVGATIFLFHRLPLMRLTSVPPNQHTKNAKEHNANPMVGITRKNARFGALQWHRHKKTKRELVNRWVRTSAVVRAQTHITGCRNTLVMRTYKRCKALLHHPASHALRREFGPEHNARPPATASERPGDCSPQCGRSSSLCL